MKKLNKYIPLVIFYVLIFVRAQANADTFSITAVDPVTGWVGSAGASCIAGCIILSDVHPGVGVIHTQAYYVSGNQVLARNYMNMGYSPQQIVDSVVAHDVQNNSTIRQYGVVDLVGGGRTAGYTGVNCTDWKGHILGMTFTVQGNILLGEQIVDSMRARFLSTPGTLADKLMAALQGGKVIGADTRCADSGKSSISAFLRVAKPTDPVGGPYYCDLNVYNTAGPHDPIDSLQVLYNNWVILNGVTTITTKVPEAFRLEQNYPNPFNPMTTINFDISNSPFQKGDKGGFGVFVTLTIYDALGKEVTRLVEQQLAPGKYQVHWVANNYPSGVYYYKLDVSSPETNAGVFSETKKLVLIK
jgi:uncharacterized Ntn-hydrolase superfamily protein